MKAYIYLLILFLFSTSILNAQSIKEIRNSGAYIYGIGQSDIYEKADKLALSDLISQISVSIEDNLTISRVEENGDYKEFALSVVKTYSSATLSNALRIEEEKKGLYTVLRYFPKDDLDKIFKSRKQAIINYTKEGIRSESKLQISDALRNLYWANILLRSHPDYSNLKYDVNDSLLLKVFLPNRINEIFSNINMEVLEQKYEPEEKYSKYTIGFKYKNSNIQSLDYTYKYKNSWSGIMSANNGLTCIEYFGDDAHKDKEISIRIAYMYKDKAFFDKDVQSVFSSDLDIPYFSKSEIKTQLNKIRKKEAVPQLNITAISSPVKNIQKDIKESLKKVIEDIEQNSNDINVNLFTASGIDAYNKLIKYGNAVVLKQTNDLKIVQVNDELLARSIPLKFNFSKNRQFVEDVVFIFNQQGKINDINFSLSQVAIDNILSKPEKFATEEERFFLIRFMENYKTAYCLKRIDYLDKVFDDDALIIVGKGLSKQKTSDQSIINLLSTEEVEYQRLSKHEYISRLKQVFANQEFVNIHFEDNIVEKANRDIPIYGIQIAQHYTSATYADRGYLFLLIDLRDTLNPIVHVRTWQPKKNADGSIYGLNDFPFQKL